MLHTFIDESYGEDDYYVGGIIVTDVQFGALELELEQLREKLAARFCVPSDIEFHAHEIMHGKGSWSCLAGSVHESVMICRKVIHAVVNAGAHIHLQGVDVRKLNARYRYPDSPYAVCLRHLLERVEDRCKQLDERSTVTADILDESNTATRVIAGYSNRSTPGYRPTRLGRIEHPIQYVDSRTSIGVQAADVITYILRRYLEVKTAHPKALKTTGQLYNAIRPNLQTCRKWEP
ncbi:DUF3800 domain-containing protein [Rhodococcus qingshengii]|uniref:DUF3800 domain-containing protein n=1 Tax=Rhodococcus qingshengii TaxID=334542 RepID=UPI001AE48503|nr:DUF3800 domain-containing protein [Rhodococcus qingshengii]MBP1054419.1 DUF3800 domain-containing protein [Rhodococcus qingshengii]